MSRRTSPSAPEQTHPAASERASQGLGAQLLPRFDVLLDHLDLDARLARAALVVTAEGALDHQTPRGKIPAEVARRAKRFGRPVLVLAGTIGQGAHHVRAEGVDAHRGARARG